MVASCWSFLYDLYYDARIHEHQLRKYGNLPLHLSAEKKKSKGLKRSRESKSEWKKEGNGLKEQNGGISKEVKLRNTGQNGKEIKRKRGSREESARAERN